MNCLLGKALAGSNANIQEIAGMLFDDREGYPTGRELAAGLKEVLGIAFSKDTVEAHRSGDCPCVPAPV